MQNYWLFFSHSRWSIQQKCLFQQRTSFPRAVANWEATETNCSSCVLAAPITLYLLSTGMTYHSGNTCRMSFGMWVTYFTGSKKGFLDQCSMRCSLSTRSEDSDTKLWSKWISKIFAEFTDSRWRWTRFSIARDEQTLISSSNSALIFSIECIVQSC